VPPVIRTEQAEADLEAILHHLDQYSPKATDRLANAVDDLCNLLERFPQMARPRDDLVPGIRSFPIEKYVLYYRLTPARLEVLRILPGSRDAFAIMKEEE
jgi:toxin ParE1/3/4